MKRKKSKMSDPFSKLRELLGQQKKWPLEYMFKFVSPNDDAKIQQVKSLLPNPEKVTFRTSKNIKYVAMTSKEMMATPESIIAIYEEVAKIEGVMAL